MIPVKLYILGFWGVVALMSPSYMRVGYWPDAYVSYRAAGVTICLLQEQLDRRIEVDDGILRFVSEMINRGVNEA